MKRPIEREKESKEEGELNREMKMALLLLSEQRNGKNSMVATSKKEMNDTVIQLRDKDGHNSTVCSSVSLSLTNFLLQLIDLLNTFYVNIFCLRGTAINHFSIVINKSYFLVIRDASIYFIL